MAGLRLNCTYAYLRVKKVSTETVAFAMAWKVNRLIIPGKNVATFSGEGDK